MNGRSLDLNLYLRKKCNQHSHKTRVEVANVLDVFDDVHHSTPGSSKKGNITSNRPWYKLVCIPFSHFGCVLTIITHNYVCYVMIVDGRCDVLYVVLCLMSYVASSSSSSCGYYRRRSVMWLWPKLPSGGLYRWLPLPNLTRRHSIVDLCVVSPSSTYKYFYDEDW